MKRQISTSFAGAFAASLLVVLSAQAFAADEASNLTQVNGSIIEDANGNSVVIVPDANAKKVSAETTSIVTENGDGSVSISNTTVLNVPEDQADEITEKSVDTNWIQRFLDGIRGEDKQITRREDRSRDFDFLYHDKYMLDQEKLERQPISEEMVIDERETRSEITDKDYIEKAKTPVLKDPADKEKEKEEVPFYEDFLFQQEMLGMDPEEKIAVSIVFNSAPILDVIPAFADALGFNFVVDADVRMNVTLNLNSSMTRRELWEAFAILIENAGVGVTVEGSLIRILPLNKFSTRSKLDINSEDAEILFYPLNYASAQEVIQQIRAFLSNSATCIQVTRPNAILLCDYKENIKKLKQLVEILDENPRTKWPRVVIPCENILPSKIAEELRTILPTLGFVVKQLNENNNNEQPGSVKIGSVDRLQLIVASAATKEAIKEIENWISILDGTVSLDQERIFVHKVMYTKAEQLMQALAVLYNMTGTSLTIDDDGSSRTTNVNGSGSNRTNNNNRNNNGVDAYYVATTTDEKSNVFETPVKIFSDGALNRLVIRTTPRTYASIKALLDRLDVVPAQVLLQVTVAEVTISNSIEFAASAIGTSTWGGNFMSMGTSLAGFEPAPTATGGGVGSPELVKAGGFEFMLADPNNPNNKYGYLRAASDDSKYKVIACPQILVSSNTEAMINVGKQTPYTGSSVTDTSSTSLLSTTSYKDSGITLTVTPQVTSTDLISLTLDQTLSTAAAYNGGSGVSAPELTTREVQTSMTIHNGQTMIIGGLIEEDILDSLSSVPIINQIPILRRLFGETNSAFERKEILILITGHIINEKSRVEDMISRYNDAIDAISEFEDNLGDSKDGKRAPAIQRMFF